MEDEKKGFVVKDKRMFDESGKTREEEAPKTETQKGPQETGGADTLDASEETVNRDDAPFHEVTFAGFILSLSTTALYHFGDFPDPATQKAEKNLSAAKQMIDTISLIENKTKGNLEEGEKNLIEGVLYELRMRYIKEKG